MDAHLANADQNNLGNRWGAGDIMYADLNGDGKIDGGSGILENTGDRTIIGNSTPRYRYSFDLTGQWRGFRSAEHTSELQSLMRISYAVFCLKQKRINQT